MVLPQDLWKRRDIEQQQQCIGHGEVRHVNYYVKLQKKLKDNFMRILGKISRRTNCIIIREEQNIFLRSDLHMQKEFYLRFEELSKNKKSKSQYQEYYYQKKKLQYIIIQRLLQKILLIFKSKISVPNTSIKFLKYLIKQYPNFAITYYNLALIFKSLKKYQKSIKYITRSLKIGLISPYQIKAYIYQAKIYQILNQYHSSLQSYQKAIQIDPQRYQIYFLKAFLYIQLKDFQNAKKHLTKVIELKNNDFDAYKQRGQIYFMEHKYQMALHDFDKALEINPQSAFIHFERGALFQQISQFHLALQCFDKVCLLQPENLAAFFYRSMILLQMKQYKKAKQNIYYVLQKNASDINAYQLLGKILYFQGFLQQSAYYLLKCVRTNQIEYIQSIFYLGKIELDRKNYNKAHKYFLRCINWDPLETQYYVYCGIALQKMDLIQQAQNKYEISFESQYFRDYFRTIVKYGLKDKEKN